MEDPGSSIENGGSILNPRSSILDLRSALAAMLAAVWLAGGCSSGPSKPQTANSVSGTVFLNGKAINYGTVAFYNANGLQRKSIILIDGSYSVHNPPLGEVKIVVETGPAPVPAAAMGGAGGGPAGAPIGTVPVGLMCGRTSPAEGRTGGRSSPGRAATPNEGTPGCVVAPGPAGRAGGAVCAGCASAGRTASRLIFSMSCCVSNGFSM